MKTQVRIPETQVKTYCVGVCTCDINIIGVETGIYWRLVERFPGSVRLPVSKKRLKVREKDSKYCWPLHEHTPKGIKQIILHKNGIREELMLGITGEQNVPLLCMIFFSTILFSIY